jgi:hypothetical protein
LAGLPELRMRDLRTTSRCAHLSRERLLDAVEVIQLAPQD